MIRHATALAAALAITAIAGPVNAQQIATAVSMKGKSAFAPPPDSASQAYFTTENGCTYRRAQAPGYAPTWHLVLNPHHIGRPAAHRGCPGSLRN